jgi:hypothetical protein
LRYGFGSNWTHRIVTINSSQIKCQTSTFNEDPIHVNKVCQFAPILGKVGKTIGNWNRIVDTDCSAGTVCGNPVAIMVGTNYDNSTTNTTSWSNNVTASIAKDGIIGVGRTVSLPASTNYAHSTSYYNEALGRIYSEARTATCSAGQSGRMVMYQFGTTTSANCLKDGSCDKTTTTADVMCVMNPPFGYEGPQCLPGYCSTNDPLCLSNTCQYPAP